MAIHSSVLALIGNTPIVKAQHLDTGVCELFLKLEAANPGGSIKDRIGLSMIEAAERRGELAPGATLVEGTAGNTGLGLALVAQQKGYRLIL
ncbi:pyridoxal-phosphate dependent enzyme, partial [Xanthomonas maliensis]